MARAPSLQELRHRHAEGLREPLDRPQLRAPRLRARFEPRDRHAGDIRAFGEFRLRPPPSPSKPLDVHPDCSDSHRISKDTRCKRLAIESLPGRLDAVVRGVEHATSAYLRAAGLPKHSGAQRDMPPKSLGRLKYFTLHMRAHRDQWEHEVGRELFDHGRRCEELPDDSRQDHEHEPCPCRRTPSTSVKRYTHAPSIAAQRWHVSHA
jgi:hypothetical protein